MRKILLIVTLALAITLVTAGVALAATSSVLTYATPGNAGYEIPHGGYSTSTDACLQCHDVHESAGDYVLMRWATVTDVCGSCHNLYLTTPGGLAGYSNKSAASALGEYETNPPANNASPVPTYDPGFAGENVVVGVKRGGVGDNLMLLGTSAQYAVYEVAYSDKSLYGAGNKGGHRLGQGAGPIEFGNGVYAQGDYIPGGSNSVTAIKPADYDNTVSAMNFTATNGLYCAACHTPHGNFGQMLLGPDNTPGDLADNPVASVKLLSAKPNHTKARIWVKDWTTDGGKWCAGCHDRRIPGAVYHNHPDSACLSCHGNYVGSNASYTGSPNTDFPHTSRVPFLLTNEPDDLCITCHVPGTLP